MKIWIMTFFYQPGAAFGIVERGFFSEEEAKKYLHQVELEQPDFQFTLDYVDVEVTLQ